MTLTIEQAKAAIAAMYDQILASEGMGYKNIDTVTLIEKMEDFKDFMNDYSEYLK